MIIFPIVRFKNSNKWGRGSSLIVESLPRMNKVLDSISSIEKNNNNKNAVGMKFFVRKKKRSLRSNESEILKSLIFHGIC